MIRKTILKFLVVWLISGILLTALFEACNITSNFSNAIIGIVPFIIAFASCKTERTFDDPGIKFDSVSMASIDQMDGRDFEYLCANLLRALGYEEVCVTPAKGDHGVDIVALKDGIKHAFQCKRYSSHVGNAPVQEVYAGMEMYGCSVGAVITNQYFTNGAKVLAEKTGVKLIDRDALFGMIKQVAKTYKKVPAKKDRNRRNYNMGSKVTPLLWPHFDSKDIDIDYFNNMAWPPTITGMKPYINAFPFEPDLDPHILPADEIITIISEPFERKDHAEHFAAVVSKHCYSVANVEEWDGQYVVKIRSHVYSIMSHYFEHEEGEPPCYQFFN